MFYAAAYGTSILFSPNSPQKVPMILKINQRNEIDQYILSDTKCSPFFIAFHHIGRYYLMSTPIHVENTYRKCISFFSNESSKQI